jgi:hypothetical protein
MISVHQAFYLYDGILPLRSAPPSRRQMCAVRSYAALVWCKTAKFARFSAAACLRLLVHDSIAPNAMTWTYVSTASPRVYREIWTPPMVDTAHNTS